MESYLEHYGTPRKSGRYPWGSGSNPFQNTTSFTNHIKELRDKGLTDPQIAEGLGMTSTELRRQYRIAASQNRAAMQAMVVRLADKGYSNTAIADRLGLANESTVRSMRKAADNDKAHILKTTTDALRAEIDDKGFIDVGKGNENRIGVSNETLKTAVQALKNEGYEVRWVPIQQLGTGETTNQLAIAKPGTRFPDFLANKDNIHVMGLHSEDNGRTFEKKPPPKAVDSKRIEVRYAEQGGAERDGVIDIRRGVPDIGLGNASYAQVRIAVDGTHYLKGMAVYADDLPPGVDIRFNTNKSATGNKKDAMKVVTGDADNPFGADTRPKSFVDSDGKKQQSVMNVVYEEGDWSDWSKSLASQVLSKQPPSLAKRQLDLDLTKRRQDLEDIKNLTNPTVRKKLLQTYADNADSAAVHLKAAAMPRQSTKVIIPINSLTPNEIFAPGYNNGETVALVRFPHGGKFEIPELKVNNKNREGLKILGTTAIDAVGINSKVADRLSGADFDGDTVLVIPNDKGAIKTSPALTGLKDFDARRQYPEFPGMRVMSEQQKENQMGVVSNLITDMTIKGANQAEIAAAVRHSMVVIDAANHKLNWKQSEDDNGIKGLQKKYQPEGGASTIISRASSPVYVDKRRPARVSEGGPIDKKTGEVRVVPTGDPGKTRSTKMAETRDARSLSSGYQVEEVYASYANSAKALANDARKEILATPNMQRSPSAAKTYAAEVSSLNSALNQAYQNKPLERRAQALANAEYSSKLADNPQMDEDSKKKIRGQALNRARERVGAGKVKIVPSEREWEAIQAGAISNHKLTEILNNSDLDRVRELATPRSQKALPAAKLSRARSMIALGYTQAEVASALGISVTTLNKEL